MLKDCQLLRSASISNLVRWLHCREWVHLSVIVLYSLYLVYLYSPTQKLFWWVHGTTVCEYLFWLIKVHISITSDLSSYTYSVEFAAVVGSTYCHDSSVTCLCWRQSVLVTGSWDSTVKARASTFIHSIIHQHFQVWCLDFPLSGGRPEEPTLTVCCVAN